MPARRTVSGTNINKVSFESGPVAVEAPVLDFYLRFWREKRGYNRMPSRSQLRPSEIRSHIASITLVEALPGMDDFRFRIVGTKVAQYFLANATGKTVRQLYAGAVKPVIDGIVRLHRSPIETAEPLLIHASATLVEGRYFTPFDVLYLPLANEAGEGAFVAAAYSFPNRPITDSKLRPSMAPPMHGAPPMVDADRFQSPAR